jgi:hypothetical protein
MRVEMETLSAQTRNEVLMFFDGWDRTLHYSPKDPSAQTARSLRSECRIRTFRRTNLLVGAGRLADLCARLADLCAQEREPGQWLCWVNGTFVCVFAC